MKKHLLFYLVPLIFLIQGCPNSKPDFIDKEFIKKGTSEKITIKIPRKCETFNTGLKVNVDAMVEYAGQEAQLAASFEKVSLISEFSDRLKAITAAQCRILHTAIIIDTNSSDFSLYNDIVNKYTEYQKVRDLISSNPSEEQKNEITKTILAVYETIYNNKKDELTAPLFQCLSDRTTVTGITYDMHTDELIRLSKQLHSKDHLLTTEKIEEGMILLNQIEKNRWKEK